jgi:hypothetical protein
MEIQGNIISILPVQTGAGKNGNWKKQDFILETEGQVRRKIHFSVWGEKIDQFNLRTGESVTVSFDLESREFNGRWYTDAKAWKISKTGSGPAGGSRPETSSEIPPPEEFTLRPEDDLPF